jgi:hypothetical protein
MSYTAAHVEAFLANFAGDPAGAYYFLAALERGSLLPVRVQMLVPVFDRLSPWEKANVLYGLTDLVDAELKKLRVFFTKNARLADDEGWG